MADIPDNTIKTRTKKPKITCRTDGCTKWVVNNGVCSQHGAKKPKNRRLGRRKKKCSAPGCTNQCVRRGVCDRHGAAPQCNVDGCIKLVQKGGLCWKHGAKYLIHPLCSLPDVAVQKTTTHVKEKVVGRRKIYSEENNEYGEWEDITMESNTTRVITLNRGGKITVHDQMISMEEQKRLSESMHQYRKYRMYSIHGFVEPRLHALLSSHANSNLGFGYHEVKMKPMPLSDVPEIESYINQLANANSLVGGFRIGVELMLYRNGLDSIGWHSDDSQG